MRLEWEASLTATASAVGRVRLFAGLARQIRRR